VEKLEKKYGKAETVRAMALILTDCQSSEYSDEDGTDNGLVVLPLKYHSKQVSSAMSNKHELTVCLGIRPVSRAG
jgi:hypothetical protein